jgi:signal transduction histidine kinase
VAVIDQSRVFCAVGEVHPGQVANCDLAEVNRCLRHEIRERKHVEKSLRDENRHLRYLLKLLERDRQLISYEIHDGLVQQLAGAIMHFEALGLREGIDRQQAVKSGVQLLRKSLQEARQLIHGLRPPILEEHGVVAAIDDLVSQSSGENQPAAEFLHKLAFDRLPPVLENAIFRIVQESLTNACRHSQSERVRITLADRSGEIRITVRDWGVGFDFRRVAEGHFGLAGIKERARLFGGSAIIRSSPGKGTRIVVVLPMPTNSLDCVAHRNSQLKPMLQ